ncbi:hypothetical protein CXB51_003322 [Gossypium anomalum]|uniref:CN hydrolase domain-containing protein n=1 Tax=Gossypium anomalum TaxID=47600 RepID=A0A8J5ZGA1_9ROSI|nr:hypothetical protein CXB51_003322 [Gossypium anomalum]
MAPSTTRPELVPPPDPITHPTLLFASALAYMEKSRVRATVVQASTVFFDTPATLDKAERLIAGSAAYGSQLVVFPEAFVGGYPRGFPFESPNEDNQELPSIILLPLRSQVPALHLSNRFIGSICVYEISLSKDDAAIVSCFCDLLRCMQNFRCPIRLVCDFILVIFMYTGPEVDRLAKISCRYKVHLVMGVVEKDGFYLFSTILFFDPVGRYLGKHLKLMRSASECVVWCSGEKSSLPLYRTAIGKVGGLLYLDNRIPSLRTELYAEGIQMYRAPTADAREEWRASMIHIAIEGRCFVLSANQFCRRKDYSLPLKCIDGDSNDDLLDTIVCSGGSVIVSPSGTILAGPNYQGESLISADLGLGMGLDSVGWSANKPNLVLYQTAVKTEAFVDLS